jgi:hypothetical protein
LLGFVLFIALAAIGYGWATRTYSSIVFGVVVGLLALVVFV